MRKVGGYLPWFISSIQGGNFSRSTCSLPLGPTDSLHRVWEELPCLYGTELELRPPPFCGPRTPPGKALFAFGQQLLTAAFPSQSLDKQYPRHKEEYL